jgi:hypothetical protein
LVVSGAWALTMLALLHGSHGCCPAL